jgi:hypothetical protein
VLITYRFHPFCGERFTVSRLFYVHDEACYIVRRSDDTPLSFPVWMTEQAAAQVEIVNDARLPLDVLLELRRLVLTGLSLVTSQVTKGVHDASRSNKAGRTVRRVRNAISGAVVAASKTGGETAPGAVDAVGCRVNQQGGGR